MFDWLFLYGLLFVVAIAGTCLFMPLARWVAVKTDAIDYPSGRRVNTKPVARTGGIAIFGGMALSLSLMAVLVNLGVMTTPFIIHPFLNVDWTWACVGVVVMFGVGLFDDVFDLKPLVKLAGQLISASIVAASGVLLVSIGDPTSSTTISLGWLSYPLTVFYLVAFANIINLVDGLDGLASGVSVISAVTIMVFAFIYGRIDVLILGCALVGACVGFLKFNWHPATIFMGDSGALVLGELLGILSLVAIARSTLFTALLVPILSAGVPIMDTFFAILRRKRAHKPVMSADRGHIHHRLLDSGHGQKQVVEMMLLWTTLLAVSGIVITLTRGWVRVAIFVAVITLSLIAILKLGVMKPILAHKYTPRLSRRHVSDGTYLAEDMDNAKKGDGTIPQVNKSTRIIDVTSSHNRSAYRDDEENSRRG